MSRPKVSIVVPTFNAAAYLPLLCRSLQSQTLGDFEVLIGNDGSNDETVAVLKEFDADKRFRIFHSQTNRGVNRMTFYLLNEIRGDYWCNPGADDLLEATFVEERIAILEANLDVVLAHGHANVIDAEGNPKESNQPDWTYEERTSSGTALSRLLQHNYINTPAVMVRSSVTRHILPHFMTKWQYAQDWYFWIMLAATGYDFIWDAKPLHSYRIHSTSLSNIPAKHAVRQAEIRLMPLCALSIAREFSPEAAELWSRFRSDLYCLWLRRAALLARNDLLKQDWLQAGGRAFYGKSACSITLAGELLRHFPGILRSSWREKVHRKKQSFPASGLAIIDDVFFRQNT
jgi:glycosyltransferase involved in cell wall biosynthesis